jgi:hypothetical protein
MRKQDSHHRYQENRPTIDDVMERNIYQLLEFSSWPMPPLATINKDERYESMHDMVFDKGYLVVYLFSMLG